MRNADKKHSFNKSHNLQLRQVILSQIEQTLKKERLSIADVCYFMQSVRLLIEIDGTKTKYKTTNHYCNWLLHKELNRSNSPVIIQEVVNSFQCFTSENDLIKRINQAISLKNLITELKEILWLNMSDKVTVSKTDYEEFWLSFIHKLLTQLLFRPLKVNKQDINLGIINLSVYGIQIADFKNDFKIELLSKELEKKDKRFLIEIALFQ